MGTFEVYITKEGDLDARCKSCHDIPRLEYLGFDPVYPHFKIVCDRCGSWTTMTFRLICHGLAGVPYRYPWDTESAIARAAQHTRLHKATKGRKP
jgi:hypothetical protein